jgi:hypothetical protein
MARPGPSGVGVPPTPLAADNSKVRLGRKGARDRDRDGQKGAGDAGAPMAADA